MANKPLIQNVIQNEGAEVGYYATGRPAYPTLLARRVANLVGLNGTQVVLDLGTGPGFLALDYHPFAARVIGKRCGGSTLRRGTAL